MTNQQLFDRVAKHLLKQKKRARNKNGTCLYYDAATGNKCAIGCLIPAKKYDADFEGEDVSYAPVAKAAGLTPGLLGLASKLQGVHDRYQPKDWEDVLFRIADQEDLLPWPRNKRSR